MTRYVYVTALESGSGKSAVVLGLAEVLSRRAGRLALFRPLIADADPPDPDIELVRRRYGLAQTSAQSYALTPADLHDMDGRDGYDRLLTRVLDRCAAVSAGADVRCGGERLHQRRCRWSSTSTSTRPATSPPRCCSSWAAATTRPPRSSMPPGTGSPS